MNFIPWFCILFAGALSCFFDTFWTIAFSASECMGFAFKINLMDVAICSDFVMSVDIRFSYDRYTSVVCFVYSLAKFVNT